MRKLLVTPDVNCPCEDRKEEQKKRLVFFKGNDQVTIFDIVSGKEEDLPTRRVLEYQNHILLNGQKYIILERMNH